MRVLNGRGKEKGKGEKGRREREREGEKKKGGREGGRERVLLTNPKRPHIMIIAKTCTLPA